MDKEKKETEGEKGADIGKEEGQKRVKKERRHEIKQVTLK